MRIIQLTPGTGSFHCGTCLRDHALTKALRRLGHDAAMAPMYLPMMLEESSSGSGDEIGGGTEGAIDRPFFGGVNVYLQQKLRMFRSTPGWIDRMFDSPRLLRWASRRLSMTSASDLGAITLSVLQGQTGQHVKELEKLNEGLSRVWAKQGSGGRGKGVVCLSNALLVGLARPIKNRLGVPVVCTLQGEDAFLDGLGQPYRDQCWQTLTARAADVDAFVAISRYYGDVMVRRLGLPAERVHVVHNGIELDGLAPPDEPPDPLTLGYFARLCQPKGLGTLVDAFLILKQRNQHQQLQLSIAGATTGNDQQYVKALVDKLKSGGVWSDVTIQQNPNRTEKIEMLRRLTVFSVPATYGEAFGLYILEALACGVPVVQPNHGAFPELLAEIGGGILCQPDDPGALADAIESLLEDPARRRILAEQGLQQVRQRFNVDRMAKQVAQVYESSHLALRDG